MNHARRDLGCRSASEAALPGTSKTKIELCHHARILAFISMSFDKVSAPVNDISDVLYLVHPMWIFSRRIWEELQF